MDGIHLEEFRPMHMQVDPERMGLDTVYAIQKVCEETGIQIR